MSNCLIFAVLLHRRLHRRWVRSGRPAGREPYLMVRKSRLAPVPHVLVAAWSGGRLRVVSFVPVDSSPLRWWQVWRALGFSGRVKWGD